MNNEHLNIVFKDLECSWAYSKTPENLYSATDRSSNTRNRGTVFNNSCFGNKYSFIKTITIDQKEILNSDWLGRRKICNIGFLFTICDTVWNWKYLIIIPEVITEHEILNIQLKLHETTRNSSLIPG
jgi:hypothetical protein